MLQPSQPWLCIPQLRSCHGRSLAMCHHFLPYGLEHHQQHWCCWYACCHHRPQFLLWLGPLCWRLHAQQQFTDHRRKLDRIIRCHSDLHYVQSHEQTDLERALWKLCWFTEGNQIHCHWYSPRNQCRSRCRLNRQCQEYYRRTRLRSSRRSGTISYWRNCQGLQIQGNPI